MPGIDSGQDRRSAYRHRRSDIGLSVLESGQPLADPALRVRDISSTGIGIQMSGRVRVGQTLRLRLDLPYGSVDCDGTVRWVRTDDTGCHVGLRFSRLGWFQGRHLRFLLEPDRVDIVGLLDRLFMAATLTMVVIVLANLLGFTADSPLAALDAVRGW